jgi:hypothetical protein
MGVDKQRNKHKDKQKLHGFEQIEEQIQDKKARRKKRMSDHADRDRREPSARRTQTSAKRRLHVLGEDDHETGYEMRHTNRKSRKDEQKPIR